MAEGSMWEGFDKASHYNLDNIVAIVDVNRLGQRGETELGWNLDAYGARLRAFGWHAIEIDGHDLNAIDAAFKEAEATRASRPVSSPRPKKARASRSPPTKKAGTARR